MGYDLIGCVGVGLEGEKHRAEFSDVTSFEKRSNLARTDLISRL